jgi:hypothetical protein
VRSQLNARVVSKQPDIKAVTEISSAWWESDAIPPFRNAVARFIDLLRDRKNYSTSDLLQHVHPLLAELYATGFALPIKPESAYEDDDDELEAPGSNAARVAEHTDRWRSMFIALQDQIGSRWNSYQEIFDPYAEPPEAPVTGSLADDLADIFLDLEDGEQLWSAGKFDAAVWNWRFGFESHWGEHVTGALRALHTLAAVHDLGFVAPGT